MRRSGIRELHQTGHDLVTDESVLPCPRLTERKALVGHVGDAVPDHVAHAAVPAREGPLTGSRTRRAASSSRTAPTTVPTVAATSVGTRRPWSAARPPRESAGT